MSDIPDGSLPMCLKCGSAPCTCGNHSTYTDRQFALIGAILMWLNRAEESNILGNQSQTDLAIIHAKEALAELEKYKSKE